VWFALQLGPSTFGIFDAFFDEAGRQAHLNGAIAQALGANAPTRWRRRRRSNASNARASYPAEARKRNVNHMNQTGNSMKQREADTGEMWHGAPFPLEVATRAAGDQCEADQSEVGDISSVAEGVDECAGGGASASQPGARGI